MSWKCKSEKRCTRDDVAGKGCLKDMKSVWDDENYQVKLSFRSRSIELDTRLASFMVIMPFLHSCIRC